MGQSGIFQPYNDLHEFREGFNAEFAQDFATAILDGTHGRLQYRGDLLIAISVTEKRY